MRAVFPILIIIIYTQAIAQTLNLRVVATLPGSLAESSGLEVLSSNYLWTLNDSGNPAELYTIDSSGNITRTLSIQNATNSDWEDMTRDDVGNIYIGDFGNNSHNKQNLVIYKIPDPLLFSTNNIPSESIHFSYPDQTAFPPPDDQKNFDMEAVIWFHDSLYLFSKNWTNPFTGYTKRYRLPTMPGTYVAELLDSFYTGPGPTFSWWITAADISPDGKKLILLSQDKLWLFSCFSGSNFFSGDVQQIGLGSFTQKEAVCFINENEIYITDELAFGTGGKLYHADLSAFETQPVVNLGADTTVPSSTLTLDAGSGFASYLWSTGDTTETITVNTSGDYWVEVASSAGCTASDTVTITLDPTNAVNELLVTASIHVSPNPFSGSTEISLTGITDGAVLMIYNAIGERVMQEKITRGFNLLTLSGRPSGLYTLILQSKEGRISEKIICNN